MKSHQLKLAMAKAMRPSHDLTFRLTEDILSPLPRLQQHLRMNQFSDISRFCMPSVLDPEFPDKYLAYNLLRKFPFPGEDTAGAALRAFAASEETCRIQNQLMLPYYLDLIGDSDPTDDRALPAFITKARSLLSRWLGPFSWAECSKYMGFGPGATTHLRRKSGDPYYKLGTSLGVTAEALPILTRVVREHFPMWKEYLETNDLYEVVIGNVVTTVPKDGKTDRPIAIEPCGNMFLQKGIGGAIRSRLRLLGLDLNHQQINNQLFAMEGSSTGKFATIDLSSASDTVSLGLCHLLLPPDWLSACMTVRSKYGLMPDGSYVVYEKMSSMGNGKTFELESIIFLALAYACTPNARVNVNVAAYGDDLIVPTEAATALTRALDWAGFTVNPNKSYYEGPFRESCGKHYWFGNDVTPVYVKEPLNSPSRAFWFANALRRYATRTGSHELVSKSYHLTRESVPRILRGLIIPDGKGDGGFIGNFDEARPTWDRNLHCLKYRTMVPVVDSFDVKHQKAGLLASCWQLTGLGRELSISTTTGLVDIGVRTYRKGLLATTPRYRVNVSHVYEWPSVHPMN